MLIYGAQVHISVEMTELSKGIQCHGALFIALLLNMTCVPCGIHAPLRNAAIQSRAETYQLETT